VSPTCPTETHQNYHKRTHKFGIEVPKSWDDCVKLNKEIEKHSLAGCGEEGYEECQNCIQDSKWRRISPPPPTYQEIRCHMIFDVNMEDFRRNSRFVAGGHTNKAQSEN
jgi:hypothetical protein